MQRSRWHFLPLSILYICVAIQLSAAPWDLRLDIGPTLMGTVTGRVDAGWRFGGFRVGVDGGHDTLYQPEEELSIGATDFRVQWVEQVSRVRPELSYLIELGPAVLSPWAGYLAEFRGAAVSGTQLHEAVPQEMGGMYLDYRREYLDRLTSPCFGLRASLGGSALRLRAGLEGYPLLSSEQAGDEKGIMPLYAATAGPATFSLYRDDFDRSLSGFRIGASAEADLIAVRGALGIGAFGSFSFTRLAGEEASSSDYWSVTGSSTTEPTAGAPFYQDTAASDLSVDTYAYEAGATLSLLFLRKAAAGSAAAPALSASVVGWVRDSKSVDRADAKVIQYRSTFRYVKLGLSLAL